MTFQDELRKRLKDLAHKSNNRGLEKWGEKEEDIDQTQIY